MNQLLPIGSVVLLNGGTKRLMIFGIRQVCKENPDVVYDYVSVPYPEGNVGSDEQYLFNHSDIQTVYFRGFEDEEREQFFSVLCQLC